MELPYDGDTNDESQYCKHGTFIGSWWGPDYMCGLCEDGVSVLSQQRMWVHNSRVRYNRAYRAYCELCVLLFKHADTYAKLAPVEDQVALLRPMGERMKAMHEAHRTLVAEVWANRKDLSRA